MSALWRRLLGRDAVERPGAVGERVAAKHLRRGGAKIVARNWRHKIGELDLVAVHGDDLVFVEVKSRRDEAYGFPAEAVDRTKRRRIERLASLYCRLGRLDPPTIRFDIVEVIIGDPPRVNWIRDAWLAGE
jgi:putative endonuclease